MNFIFRKLFKNIPPEKEAKFLTKVASGSGHMVFLDKYFRQLVDFDRQSQLDQDRIFNELVVTGLIVLLSAINDRIPDIEPARQNFWRKIYDLVPRVFTDWLLEIGVEKKYVKIWRKLIDLRYDEYKEKQTWTRRAWFSQMYNSPDNSLDDAAVRVETLTISSLLHITKGKAKKDEPLRRHLRTWLSVLNNKLERRVGW